MTLAQRVAYLARPVHLRRRVRHVSPLRWPTPAQNYLVRESRQIPCPGCTWGWLHRLSQVQLSGLWRDVYALRYSLFAPCEAHKVCCLVGRARFGGRNAKAMSERHAREHWERGEEK